MRFYKIVGIMLSIISLMSCQIDQGDNVGYLIHKLTFESKTEDKLANTIIDYPEVNDMCNKDLQDKINTLIKDTAIPPNKLSAMSITIRYEITMMNESVLSIVFLGGYYGAGAPYPVDLFSTLNINMETGTKMRLNDFVNIDAELLNRIRNYKNPNTEKYPAFDYPFEVFLEENSDDEIINMLKMADSDSTAPFRGNKIESFLTYNGIGLSILVAHVAGDHIELELPYL